MTDTTDPERADIGLLLDDLRACAARLGGTLDTLGDRQARGPCALPGWSRAHVITHLARSADAYGWLLALARTGTAPGPRADAAALDRALREGAERDAAGLVADLGRSLDRLFEEAAAMPDDRWPTLVSALAGWRHPAWYTLHRARRELETHHVDLALGYTAADWPDGYVTWALDETVAALSVRGFPVARLEASDLGRAWTLGPSGPTVTGPGHALLAWLTGRGPDTPLVSDRPLPAPPRWPQPPVPGWD
ncbi:maleylpyruvate isomerase family mycothiol-dependent enzyme [Streptomyces sp. NK08204]|uniref:maleylpyruvate isomerase family mycothiol-dependent enzyme n=1 Tax=Streptomyces sp. NK08204 TaxID=2873260 RepID=UPI001CEC3B8A|nr:maleylpyruvate isomerase family mycothiol-dependent enzyme [Streptomyces sp. NK08204]